MLDIPESLNACYTHSDMKDFEEVNCPVTHTVNVAAYNFSLFFFNELCSSLTEK